MIIEINSEVIKAKAERKEINWNIPAPGTLYA